MMYGKVIFNGGDFKIAVCNYPSPIVAGSLEYALIKLKENKTAIEEVESFIAQSDSEALQKGLDLAKKHNLE